MSLKQFEIVSKIGQGACSTVYKVYALKTVKLPILSSKQKENALNEVRLLASIRHPHMICYKEAFIDQNSKSLCIVMQYANNGDLHQKISEKIKKNQFFKESEIWAMFSQLVKGLKQLHQLQILHRDIKSANVFLMNDGTVKLGDLNVSKVSEKGLCMTQTGTPYYASPQIWKDQPYDFKSDIWSLGCVLYEMITLKPPFKGDDMQALFKKVTRGIYSRIPSQFSQDLSNLVRCLLQINPSDRPSCQKILKMPAILKRVQNRSPSLIQKPQLYKTIRQGQNLQQISEQFPKPNYHPLVFMKEKGIHQVIETLQSKEKPLEKVEPSQMQSLPHLQRDKKIRPSDNSQRLILKHKQSMNVIERQRKQSEMSCEKCLQINGINYKSQKEELKLPKVQNRYNRKQRINKQKSVRGVRDITHY